MSEFNESVISVLEDLIGLKKNMEKLKGDLDKQIKIYDMDGGITWIAAASPDDAIKAMANHCGYEEVEKFLSDHKDAREDMEEISAEDYQRLDYFLDETDPYSDDYKPEGEREGMFDGLSLTFRQRLDQLIEQNREFPCFFATSEY